jgi:hypothetical protein
MDALTYQEDALAAGKVVLHTPDGVWTEGSIRPSGCRAIGNFFTTATALPVV